MNKSKRPLKPEKRIGFILSVIFLFAFVLRIIYVVVGSQELTYDEPYYDHIASQIASGNGFTFAFSAWFTSIPNQSTSVQEPVYPLFLASLKVLFGLESYQSARLVQAFVGALIPIIIGILGARLFGWGVGILSASVLAVYPPLIYFGRFLMTETLYIFFLVATVYFSTIQVRSNPGTSFLGGVTIGLAGLTRSILILFTPVYLFWIFLTSVTLKKKLLATSLTFLGICLVMIPWVWRNYLVHNALVLTPTKGGWNIYFYNYPIANYDFNNRWDDIPVPDVKGLTEVERNKMYFRLAVGFIKENPRLIASFAISKLVDFWNPLLKGEIWSLSLINIVSYGLFTLLAFIGLLRQILYRNLSIQAPVVLIWLLIGFYMVQAMIFTGGGKARLPIEPFLVLLGCETIWITIVQMRNRFQISGLTM